MSNISNINTLSTADLLKGNNSNLKTPSSGFADKLKSAINEANTDQVDSQKAMSDMASGQVKDLHQAAIAIGKAEISMKMMLEVRNKALNAYKEITRTQL